MKMNQSKGNICLILRVFRVLWQSPESSQFGMNTFWFLIKYDFYQFKLENPTSEKRPLIRKSSFKWTTLVNINFIEHLLLACRGPYVMNILCMIKLSFLNLKYLRISTTTLSTTLAYRLLHRFWFQILPVTYTSIYIMSDEKNVSDRL